jgi:hypothetical protein
LRNLDDPKLDGLAGGATAAKTCAPSCPVTCGVPPGDRFAKGANLLITGAVCCA